VLDPKISIRAKVTSLIPNRTIIQWKIAVGCTIVLWRKSGRSSYNQRVWFLWG